MRSSRLHAAFLRAVSAGALRTRALPWIAKRRKADRESAERELAGQSGLFDPDWYLRTYPDVADAKADPLIHFMATGWREGRDPGPEFVTSAYLKANPDVARSGRNPLLHYIEFGHAEGRGTFDHRPLASASSAALFNFSDPAPCLSFPLTTQPPIRWRRSYRLRADRPEAVASGNLVLGYASDPEVAGAVLAAFDVLAALSNGKEHPRPGGTSGSGSDLVDAWYVSSVQLRTRWTGTSAFVVRAYQRDPLDALALRLVGEGLSASSIDFIDVHLANPYFPVLFVLADADGALRGSRLLAFPSLCRGGLHYPELLALTRDGPGNSNAMELGNELAARLMRLRGDDEQAAVGSIEVDLRGADGTAPIFQREFKLWLERVAGVSVSAAIEAHVSDSDRYLRDSVTVRAEVPCRKSGAKMVIAHDMVPTIAGLSASQAEKLRPDAVWLLVSGSEPSQPALSFEFSANSDVIDHLQLDAGVVWPRLIGSGSAKSPDAAFPAAIKLAPAKPLTDAELLIPVIRRTTEQAREPITWLVEVKDWHQALIPDALECIALQSGSNTDAVALIGPVDRQLEQSAHRRFASVRKFRSRQAAIESIDTPHTAYVGSGVLLHNKRAGEIFSRLLQHETVASVSCVLISGERHGKSWHGKIADAGALRARSGARIDARASRIAADRLWRSCYPVAAASPHLWAARTSSLGPLGPESAAGLHVCTSLLTASHVDRGRPAATPVVKTSAGATAELLFG